MDEMRQLISKRSGETARWPQQRGQRETITAGSDGGRATDLLKSIEDSVSEADKSLVRAAASQEALSINVGLLAADLKEVSFLRNISSIKVPTFCHRKPVFSKNLAWSSRAPSASVSW